MKIALYAHGGSENHGCEALVRSTIHTLGEEAHQYRILSEHPEEDIIYHLDQIAEISATQDLPSKGLRHLMYLIKMKIYKSDRVYYEDIYRSFASRIGNVDLALAVGGDNYCYRGFLERFGVQNRMLVSKGIRTVLWGCSIDPERINDAMVKDLSLYSFVTVRESITYNALINAGLKNVYLIPDTAFNLPKIEQPLPSELSGKDSVGINMSPLITGHESTHGITLANYEHLISHILNTTNMSVMLIPHVVWSHNDDRIPLTQLYDKFKSTGRIVMLDDHDCCTIKGYISRCRFLVAARTHASIAGYSTGVPTLVVGYSVKARGIATDLFGTDQNYVVPVSSLKDANDLSEAFGWMMQYEGEIRKKYDSNLTRYIGRLAKVKEILK